MTESQYQATVRFLEKLIAAYERFGMAEHAEERRRQLRELAVPDFAATLNTTQR